MSNLHRSAYLAATKSVEASTSTGAGSSIPTPPLSFVSAQAVVDGAGTGSFSLEGSLDGVTWATIVAASTYTANRLVSSSTIPPVAYVRAVVTLNASTNPVSIWIAGR